MFDVQALFPLLVIAVALVLFFKWVGRDMSGPSEKKKSGR